MTELYKKVGRKYVDAGLSSEYDHYWPYGSHLVVATKGSQLTHYNIEPAIAPLVAASKHSKDAMTKALHDKLYDVTPNKKPETPEQLEALRKLKVAWRNYEKVMRSNAEISLYRASINDVAEAGAKALELEAQKMLSNPSVKDAYDKFLLVYKLTKENENVQ